MDHVVITVYTCYIIYKLKGVFFKYFTDVMFSVSCVTK